MSRPRQLVLPLLTGILVGLAPAVSFLSYHDYNLLKPEAVVYQMIYALAGALAGFIAHFFSPFVSAIVLATLLLFSFDLQFAFIQADFPLLASAIWIGLVAIAWALGRNALKITLAGYCGILLSTLALSTEKLDTLVQRAASPKATDKPIVLHLVLDGYIGAEGVPLDVPGGQKLHQEIRSLFEGYDFQLFGGAYSESIETRRSLTMVFNDTDSPDSLLEGIIPGRKYTLLKNKYLEEMNRLGFRIHVRQSTFLDLCAPQQSGITECRTSKYDRLGHVADMALSLPDKLTLFASFQLANSQIYDSLKTTLKLALHTLSDQLPGFNYHLWANRLESWEQTMIWPLSQANVFEEIYNDMRNAAPGDLYLIHHMKPHGPYVYDSECVIRPVSEWLHRRYTPVVQGNNTPASRRERYARYIDQVRCLNSQLRVLLSRLTKIGMLEKMVIIIHGDHGSRIFLHPPARGFAYQMTPFDHRDAFSTLFAIRIPGMSSTYRTMNITVRSLVWTAMHQDLKSLTPPTPEDELDPVSVWDKGQYQWVPYKAASNTELISRAASN